MVGKYGFSFFWEVEVRLWERGMGLHEEVEIYAY